MMTTESDKKKEYMISEIDQSWNDFFNKFGWEKVFAILEEVEKDLFLPAKEDVFRLFRELPLDKIKVVIIGQDPYHQKGVADGFSFSTRKQVTPASLRNIFSELRNDLGIKVNKNNLDHWVRQGVFLLNTCLTVKENKALSHKTHWFDFSKSLISYIENKNDNLVWVFWGNNAKAFKNLCNVRSKSIIESPHPSPFSADFGFFNSKPFSKINQFLKNKKEEKISWEN